MFRYRSIKVFTEEDYLVGETLSTLESTQQFRSIDCPCSLSHVRCECSISSFVGANNDKNENGKKRGGEKKTEGTKTVVLCFEKGRRKKKRLKRGERGDDLTECMEAGPPFRPIRVARKILDVRLISLPSKLQCYPLRMNLDLTAFQ